MVSPIMSFVGRLSQVRITIDKNGLDEKDTAKPKFGKQILWFVAIYAASVVVFAAVSGALSMLLPK